MGYAALCFAQHKIWQDLEREVRSGFNIHLQMKNKININVFLSKLEQIQ